MINHRLHPRLLKFGATIALLVALLAFFARAAAAQDTWSDTTRRASRPDSTLRLTLGDAIRIASHQNVQVEAARYRVREASARVTQRRADLLPQVSGVVTERGSTFNSAALFPIDFPAAPGAPPLFDPNGTVLGPLNALDARARLSQSVLDLAAVRRVQGARTSVKAADADAAYVSDQIGATAANAYILVLRAEATVGARLADSTLAAELLGIAQDQLRAGTGVALDVTRARSQLVGSRAQLIVARNERDRTRVELARQLGLPITQLVLSDSLASLPVVTTAAEAAAYDAALRNRKDLQSLGLQAHAAQQQADAVRKERLPSIGVFGDQGLAQRNGRSYLPTYDWGVQLSVPVFDGLRREGRIEEELAVAHDLEARERDLREQVEADVRIAVLNLTSSAEAVAAARERVGLAEQEVAQARERFQAGVSGNADVITASLTLNVARTQYVDALASYHASRVGLARAQGAISSLD